MFERVARGKGLKGKLLRPGRKSDTYVAASAASVKRLGDVGVHETVT